VYEIIDLRTGDIVSVGTDLELMLKGLPEGIYEVRKDGKFVQFYIKFQGDTESWI